MIPKHLSEADRLYAMLEVKGILDIDKDDGPLSVADQEEPMLNAKLI